MTIMISCDRLSDAALLEEVQRRVSAERQCMAALLVALGALDTRRLYLGQGCASLFTYCTQVLHLSEHAAYGRIAAARAARRFPEILDLLADASINLTTVCLLAPVLTEENSRTVLDSSRHKSRREVEQIVAALRPQSAAPTIVRKLPAPHLPSPEVLPHHGALPTMPAAGNQPIIARPAMRPAEIKPIAPELYKVQFTMSRETHMKLRRVQDLLRHQLPNGDPAAIVDRALTLLLNQLERKRLGATSQPRAAQAAEPQSRHVPAAVRRAVWSRDEGRCAFVGAAGRCRETGFLELHHVVPYATGGKTTVTNLELRCRAHNRYEATLVFGT